MKDRLDAAFANELESRFCELHRQITAFASSRFRERWCGAAEFEDFAQEVLIEYTQVAARHGHCSVQTALLWQIARRRLIDRQRQLARIPGIQPLPGEHLIAGQPQSSLATEDSSSGSMAGFDIGKRDLEFLRYKFLLGYTYRRIAHNVGMKPEGVRMAVRRAKSRLAKQFAL